MTVKLIYSNDEVIGTVETNQSMSLDQVIELLEIDLNVYDYEALTLEW